LQLHPIIDAQGDAPLVDGVWFSANTDAQPEVVDNQPNDTIVRYSLALGASFDPALAGHVYLGDVIFTAPATAKPGQVYTLRFVKSDGAPDLQTAYQFESFRASAWISSAASNADSKIPDEWKNKFFGSVTNALAADDADSDGDGLSNLQEYLAGSNPTNASSCVQFLTPVSDGAGGVVLSWLSAPQKNYTVEYTTNLGGTKWTALGGAVTGTGSVQTLTDSGAGGASRYYRLRVEAQ
jgi:hypothetical protein